MLDAESDLAGDVSAFEVFRHFLLQPASLDVPSKKAKKLVSFNETHLLWHAVEIASISVPQLLG